MFQGFMVGMNLPCAVNTWYMNGNYNKKDIEGVKDKS